MTFQSSDDTRPFWDAAAKESVFTHPLDLVRFRALVETGEYIVDYGCGYGRICAQLKAAGYGNVHGFDISRKLIARGLHDYPHLDLDLNVITGPELPCKDHVAGAVIMFAVLMCIISDEDQKAVIAETRRVLKPGGIIYISDMGLQDDALYRARYDEFVDKFDTYGVFETEGGGVFRHHDMQYFEELVSEYVPVYHDEIEVVTMHGHPVQVFQYFGRRTSFDIDTEPGTRPPKNLRFY